MAENSSSKRVVIVGGGVIGCATAYYLTQQGCSNVTVFEATGVACAASGKAGGFLASNWCGSGPLGKLASKSFQLHSELAEKHNGSEKYGYRRVDTLSITYSSAETGPSRSGPHGSRKSSSSSSSHPSPLPSFLESDKILSSSPLGTTANTAQVHPGKFTETMMEEACKGGATVRIARVEGLISTGGGGQFHVEGVRLEGGEEVAADVVVLCMGPWTSNARSWNKSIPKIIGQRAHSVTFRVATPFSAHCLFVENILDRSAQDHPEIYPRADGEVYLCGASGNPEELRMPADQVQPLPGACESLLEMGRFLCPDLREAPVEKRQSCYLPVPVDGEVVLGPLGGSSSLFIAAGHSCWGILNAPATGLALSELILYGSSKTIDISPFFP